MANRFVPYVVDETFKKVVLAHIIPQGSRLKCLKRELVYEGTDTSQDALPFKVFLFAAASSIHVNRCWAYFPKVGFGNTNYTKYPVLFMVCHS